MSYCQGFEHDIFISYAHADNWDGWITDLHQTLIDRLPEDLYQKPAIWRDEGGLDGKLIDAGITQALENSALFIAVASGAFLNSSYCVPVELSGFRHKHFPNSIREYSRVITVIYKIPEERPIEKWPDELKAVQGVRFDSPSGIPYLRPPHRDPKDPYWLSLEQLVRKIKAVLLELRKGTQEAPLAELASAPTSAAAPAKRTAYQAAWKPNVHLTFDEKNRQRADELCAQLTPHCEYVSMLSKEASASRRQTSLKNADGHILLFDCPDIEWAEGLTPESLAVAAGEGRPRKIGLYTDCPRDFAIHSSLIRPIARTPDGPEAFLSELKDKR